LTPKYREKTKSSTVKLACLQAVCGCFYRGKNPENAEFAIAHAAFDARENQSGASDKATGWGPGEPLKNRLPEDPSFASGSPTAISLPVPSLVTHSISANKIICL